mmetsp:Transcript_123180/g.184219  ORF Transcript_123180/g.184219 Transcript_123180/m.184219 type:complete len:222 (-) Transcript_123180:50-715(-)
MMDHRQQQQKEQNAPTETHSTTTKSVTFAATAKMRLALHINQYTEAEIEACYYNGKDFRSFKLDVKRTVRMMEMKVSIDGSNTCTRGTEGYVREAALMRSKVRRAAQATVLKEQWKQCKNGQEQQQQQQGYQTPNEEPEELDWEKIAAKYAPVSGASAVAAYVMGLSDAEVAKEQAALEARQQGREKSDRSSNVAFQLLKLRKANKNDRISPRREVYNSAA